MMLKCLLEFLAGMFAGSKIQYESDRQKLTASGLAAVLISLMAWHAGDMVLHYLAAAGSLRRPVAVAAGQLPPRSSTKVIAKDH